MKQITSFPKFASVLMLAGLVILSSCKKDNNSTTTSDSAQVTEVVQSDAVAEDQFNDVFNITMGLQASDAGEDIGIGSGAGVIYRPAGSDGTLSPDSTSRCFTVTVSPKTRGVFPKTATIDFGTGCLGKDGKVRSGKIISVYTGPMFLSGNSVTITDLQPTTTYFIAVYEFNGSGGTENYFTTSPATGNKATINSPVGWQIYAQNTVNIINFDNTVDGVNNDQFEGDGLEPVADNGDLSSNAFAITGSEEYFL